jgi:predicted RNase H-like nuclease (RuvC/YqgF family)
MFAQELRHRIGSFLNSLLLNGKNQEIESLKREIEVLKQGLNGGHAHSVNSLKREIETLRADLEGSGDTDRAMLRQEFEILRNELLENVTAIHRLEILTLAERIELLNDFGKALPPTRAGKTRDSSKPKGFSFGIITNGKRNEKDNSWSKSEA